MERRARLGRVGPGDLSPGTTKAPGNGQAAFHEKPHRDGGCVPTTCHQPFEQCRLGRLGIEMKRLGVELLRKRLDLLFIDPMRAAYKSLSDVQVLEVEKFLLARL